MSCSGLMLGASWWLPTQRPTTRAPTSLATVAMMAPNKKAMPCRSGKVDGDSSRPAYEPRSATHPTTNIVDAVPATADPRSTPNRYHSKVKAVISTRTSGSAATPLVYAPTISEMVPTSPSSVAGRQPARRRTAKASPAAKVTTNRQRISAVTVPSLKAKSATTATAMPVPTRTPVLPPPPSRSWRTRSVWTGGPPPVTSGV